MAASSWTTAKRWQMLLAGKLAVITGSTSGIGLGIARALVGLAH
jgi:NADP-dependent 3-hydroxy acid dehydrogenase YdfG